MVAIVKRNEGIWYMLMNKVLGLKYDGKLVTSLRNMVINLVMRHVQKYGKPWLNH